jgi:molybdopterin molybdotransferase
MISVEEALKKILHFVNALESEEKPLLDCLGRVLAEDIYAPFDVPPRDNSAMDGYATRTESIIGATPENPKILRVIGEVPAGLVPELKVKAGYAVRIMTGALVPQGADVVVPFEDTDEVTRNPSASDKTEIGVYKQLPSGLHIRQSGEDISKGELVMSRGKQLRPADLGVLASIGKGLVSVVRRPVVAILATGNEVVDVNQPLPPGKIYNSNTYSLAAQVSSCGGIPKLLGIVPDNFEQISSALRRGLNCDMLLTSGGVSVGDYDVVKEVLTREGDISFWTVRMKPGKPLAFGVFQGDNGRKVPHLGLPGNPVSSMITFEIFARPSILKMMGRNDLIRPTIKAVVGNSIQNKDGRRIFARAIITRQEGQYFARLTGPQGSGILSSVVKANGLVIIPETADEVEAGAVVDVVVLEWGDVLDL